MDFTHWFWVCSQKAQLTNLFFLVSIDSVGQLLIKASILDQLIKFKFVWSENNQTNYRYANLNNFKWGMHELTGKMRIDSWFT